MNATGEVTERITRAISARGMFKRTVAQLAGIDDSTWYRRAHHDDWRTSEVRAIADVLRVSFERLAGTR